MQPLDTVFKEHPTKNSPAGHQHQLMERFYRLLGLLMGLLMSVALQAQQPSKLNATLHRYWQQTPVQQRDSIQLPILMQGDLEALRPLIKQYGGQYRYGAKDIAAVALPLSGLEPLLQHPALKRLEYREAKGHYFSHPEDSIMLQHNRVLPVHRGQAPLAQPLLGAGVLLGMIDDGIEWQHPDFWAADSSTRLQSIWDQNTYVRSYAQWYYGYGSEWLKTDIDRYQCTHTPGAHGSHVLGIAAGNGQATGKYVGLAPKTDLACVAIADGNQFLSGFVDGVHHLFSWADRLEQPCVINSSVGSYSSGHDGKDLYAQLVAQLIEAKPGRALVQAAGNARQSNFHVRVNHQQDTAWVPFAYHASAGKTHFAWYADTADLHQMSFSLALLPTAGNQPLAQTRTFRVQQFTPVLGGLIHHTEVLFHDAQGQPVTLELYIDQYADAYGLEVAIYSATDLGTWRLQTQGTGTYDIWSDPDLLETSAILSQMGGHYRTPDNNQSIVGYWTCAAPVVVVGAYQNRTHMVNYTGDTVNVGTVGYPVPGIAAFSSVGPTRTGLLKPDLNAPGGQVMSAGTLGALRFQRGLPFSNRLDADGWHWLNRGTSMSAPMVAAALALYLECQPEASWDVQLQALHRSARVDGSVLSPVVAHPNTHWGYGKLDALALVEQCLVRGCMDSSALNFNPQANVPDSAACQYVVAVQSVSPSTVQLHLAPNPAQGAVQLTYQLAQEKEAQLSIYNTLGQLVYQQQVAQKEGSQALQVSGWLPGCYIVVLEEAQQMPLVKQLVVVPTTP